jgi:anti-sigma-K factor RskA
MSTEEIIASGDLELYVTGGLPEADRDRLTQAVQQDPKLQKEVEAIEASLIALARSVSPSIPAMVWSYILESIRNVRTVGTVKRTNWGAISGWAAAILAIAGIFWFFNQNSSLENELKITTTENSELKQKIEFTESELEITEDELAATTDLLDVLRSRNYETITLPGNKAVAPDAFAKAYFNAKQRVVYIDSRGLPEASQSKVYQLWSLKLDPLAATSVGILEKGTEVTEGIYKFENIPDPEAFGITLEPAGGSESPTLSQLYILGAVAP